MLSWFPELWFVLCACCVLCVCCVLVCRGLVRLGLKVHWLLNLFFVDVFTLLLWIGLTAPSRPAFVRSSSTPTPSLSMSTPSNLTRSFSCKLPTLLAIRFASHFTFAFSFGDREVGAWRSSITIERRLAMRENIKTVYTHVNLICQCVCAFNVLTSKIFNLFFQAYKKTCLTYEELLDIVAAVDEDLVTTNTYNLCCSSLQQPFRLSFP